MKAELDIDALFHDLYVYSRERTIRGLLTGNDTGCFTTEQYTDAHLADKKVDDKYRDGFRRWFQGEQLGEKHLRDSPSVREVCPGLWAAKWYEVRS